jgi:hypothetical protein
LHNTKIVLTFAAEIIREVGIPETKKVRTEKNIMAGETPALHDTRHAEPARRPRSMTLDTLADVMRSGRQNEVVERIAARDDDDC